MKKIFVFSFALLLSSIFINAQIIHVPGDQATIQDGIGVAVDGDVVLVAEGTYYENLNFMGKAITVASHYYLDGKKRHIKKTIINGSQPANPDYGTVVLFVSGEDTNSVLCGFTITGGSGTKLNIPGYPEFRVGGGVFCNLSSAKICNNIFKENIVQGSPVCFGGGIATGPPGFPFPIVIEDNVFTKNEVHGLYSADGGGVSNYLSGRITNNKFINNYVYCEMGIAGGGGLSSWTARDASAQLIVVSWNTISHNKTESNTSGTIGAIGGGLETWGFNFSVTNNIITHNEVISFSDYSYGAGVLLDFPDDNVFFKNNIVSKNFFSGVGGCLGGGISIWDGDAQLYNNIISKNKASHGAGIYVTIENTISRPDYINNTIVKNKATIAGGGIYSDRSEPTLMNSILWNNKAPQGSEIFVDGGTLDVSYSDVKGGWTGTGNIDVNPKLKSKLNMLNHNSPCIDAGNPLVMYNDPEDPLNLGFALYPARGTVQNDMGAYGGPGVADWYELLEKVSYDNEEFTLSTPVNKEIKIDNYPNPFNPQTTIQIVLPTDGFVSLKIYNVLGQEVATLVSDNLSAGSYKYVWNANNFASGIYIYRLESDGIFMDKKMILLR
jgi:hypothetical protein